MNLYEQIFRSSSKQSGILPINKFVTAALLAGPRITSYNVCYTKLLRASFLLNDGRTIFIREMRDDDMPQLLDFMKLVMEEEKDFYDIVGARVYSEILGVKRKRLKDPFTLLGLIDRITSYNVCYTKLLRCFRICQLTRRLRSSGFPKRTTNIIIGVPK